MTSEEFLAKFRIAFPELSAAPDERVLFFYSLAQDEMNAGVWANLYEQGILNLVAHMLVSKYGSDGNGLPNTTVQQEVTSKTVAKLSKGMAILFRKKSIWIFVILWRKSMSVKTYMTLFCWLK